MSRKRYPEEFKIEAVKQVTEAGHPYFGHCANGEPEPIAWLYDTEQRWCMAFKVLRRLPGMGIAEALFVASGRIS